MVITGCRPLADRVPFLLYALAPASTSNVGLSWQTTTAVPRSSQPAGTGCSSGVAWGAAAASRVVAATWAANSAASACAAEPDGSVLAGALQMHEEQNGSGRGGS